MFRNTYRLFFSNTSLVWKLMLYALVIGGIICSLAFATALPIIDALRDIGFVEELKSMVISLFSIIEDGTLGVIFSDLIIQFVTVVSNPNCILFTSLFLFETLVLGRFLFSMYSLVASEILYSYMSSCCKLGFMSLFVEKFGKNVKLCLAKLFTSYILDIAIVIVLSCIIKLFTMGGLIILAPFIIVLVFVILYAFKTTLFCGWEPAIVATDKGMFGCLKKGFVAIKRRFWRIYLSAIALVFSLVALNLFAILCTLGACLIITIPSCMLLLSIFQMVAYFGSQGMRYYVEENLVITPKKLELTDSIKKAKYTI